MMTDSFIQTIQQALNVMLPTFYTDFIRSKNLQSTRNFNELTSLLGTEDLTQMNQDYEIQRWMPGYIMIGNDSGDNGILIREAGANDPRIYLAGLGVLSIDDSAVLDHSIITWEQRGYPCESEEVVELSPYEQRRNTAMEEYHATADFAWHQRAGNLEQDLKNIDKAKADSAIDLKTYLSRKKEIQAEIASHNASNNNYLPFNKWWKE